MLFVRLQASAFIRQFFSKDQANKVGNVLFPAKVVSYKVVYMQQKALLFKDTALNL